MARTNQTKNYFLYMLAVFISAIFAFFGKPAPAWVMKATGQETYERPIHHSPVTRHVAATARRSNRPARTKAKRHTVSRSRPRAPRLTRKTIEKTGLAGAAIVAGEHHA